MLRSFLTVHKHFAQGGKRTTVSLVRQYSGDARAVCHLYDLGLVPYQEAWVRQKEMQAKCLTNADHPDSVFVVEHPPVFTLGRGATEDNVLFDPSCERNAEMEIHRVERGGEVTYHGPGQVVVYPILNLNRHKRDLHWYLRECEEVIIRTLAEYGVVAVRDPEYTGVWVADGHLKMKIAAMGFSVSRWVTMHGFALNVNTDLAPFERIIPCGIDDEARGVTSLQQELDNGNGRPLVCASDRSWSAKVSKTQVKKQLLKHFAKVFSVRVETAPSTSTV